PHVADFGLAGRFDPSAPRTLTAAVVGTPAYMAPEQARAPKEVTVAADVYGLGAVLYHQLTGRPPFRGATPLSTLEQAANDPPPRPSAVNPAVPRDLETVCLKCLEKEPVRRYATALELAADLERWRTGRAVLARPTRSWEHAWRWARQHPVVAGMGVVTAAALVLSVVVLAESNAQIQAKQRETNEAYLRECALRYKLTDALAREQHSLYLERVASAGRLVAANQLPQAWHLLDQCPEAARGWEWKYLDALRRAAPNPLAGHENWVEHVAVLADGRIVSADRSNAVRVWDGRGATVRQWQLGDDRVHGVSAHPTRNWVVAHDARRVAVWDADAGELVKHLPVARRAVFSPCGRWLALAAGDTVRVLTVPEWQPVARLPGHAGDVSALAFTPDGDRVLTADGSGAVKTWDAATGEPAGESWRRPRAVTGLAFTGDGKWLVESHAEGVVVADPATGRHLHRVAPTAAGRTLVAADPAGGRVAVVGPDREVIIWDCGLGRAVRAFRGHTAGVTALAFARDGRRLASGGGDQVVRVWAPEREVGGRVLEALMGPVGSLASGGAGERVALTARVAGSPQVRGVMVLDGATGRRERLLGGTGDCAASPDGAVFAACRTGGGVTVWDAPTGTEAWHRIDPALNHPMPAGARLAVAAGGARVAVRAAGGPTPGPVRVWDAAGGGRDIPVGDRFLYALALTRDGAHLAAAGADGAGVWEAGTGAKAPWTDGPREAYAVAFSPDGATVAVSEPGAVRTRSAQTGRVEQTFAGNPLRVNALAYSPDGSRLLTGGSDGTVRVWNAASGHELLTLLAGSQEVTAVAWAGDRVFAAARGAVHVWAPSLD
ncbi:protein kinase, partial [bacterium]|nr:protein kinase [bacterium]